MQQIILIEGINPEPWAVGTLGLGRKAGGFYPTYAKNPLQDAYQKALAENITEAYPVIPMQPEDIPLELTMLFWRRQDTYTTPKGRKTTRKVADATNLGKATEDALQGILFRNDRQVKRSIPDIVKEGPDVEPRIVIICRPKHSKFNWTDYAEGLANFERPQYPGNVYVEIV